ncbi:hypothetical protein J132_09260 [Termitomyces sp. J132]|nr:hypothetical protein J132_09260 [Termitomyces sp. J132]
MVIGVTFSVNIDADEECALTLSASSGSNKQGCLQVFKYSTSINSESTIGQLIDALSDPASLLSVMRLRKLTAFVSDDSSYTDCQRILELTSPYLEELAVSQVGPFDNRLLQYPRPEILRAVSLFTIPSDIDGVVRHPSILAMNHPNLSELGLSIIRDMRLTDVRDFAPDLMAGFKLLDDKIMSKPLVTNLKLLYLGLHIDFQGKANEEIPMILELIIPHFLSTRCVEVVDLSHPTYKVVTSLVDPGPVTMVNLYL